MVYKLIITEKADTLLDNIVNYVLFELKNHTAAKQLLDEVENTYKRIENNPYQFPKSRDQLLFDEGFREAIISNKNYVIIYSIQDPFIYIVGVYHQSELYSDKIHH